MSPARPDGISTPTPEAPSPSLPTATQGSKGALVAIDADGNNVQLHQTGLTLLPNTSYTISFDAYCSSGNDVALTLCQDGPPYTAYGLVGRSVDLTSSWKSFTVQFTTSGFSSTVTDGRFMFWFAPYDQPGDQYHIDNVVLGTTGSITPTPPTITTQPVAETVALGSTATFSVVATGTAPLTYQWQKNAANISGATAASYTTPATVKADSGAILFSGGKDTACGHPQGHLCSTEYSHQQQLRVRRDRLVLLLRRRRLLLHLFHGHPGKQGGSGRH